MLVKGRDHLEDLGIRWEGNVRLDVRETGWDSVDWIHLTQDRNQWWALMNTVMNIWVP
jgi:hypothetical protein